MIGTDVLFSSKSENWETPQYLFDQLNAEFRFDLDCCASEQNKKCQRFFSKEDDGLSRDWVGRVWCNPPYGRGVGNWVKKAKNEVNKRAAVVVMLLPARTDTQWFHDYIYNKPGVEVRFIKGRLKFGGSKDNAPFPNMVVVFTPEKSEA